MPRLEVRGERTGRDLTEVIRRGLWACVPHKQVTDGMGASWRVGAPFARGPPSTSHRDRDAIYIRRKL